MNFQMIIIFIVLTFARGQDRQITPILNPGCDGCTDDNPLVYIKANSSKDTIHQVWDFTRGIPTVIYMIGSPNSTLNITWDRAQTPQFELSEEAIYSFAVAIDMIYEYDDLHDNGYIDPECPQQFFSLRHLSWHRNDSVLTEKEAMLLVHAHYKDGRRSGTVDMKLDLLPFRDYADSLPHLIHSANSSLIDIRLVNLTSAEEYNATRYALHMLLVSTDPWTDSWNYTMRKSLDDEHTPGVFEIVEIKSPKSSWSNDGGFLQFRPVAYTDAERDVSSSTNTHTSTHFNKTRLPSHSTLERFYRSFDRDHILVQDMFVSFGLVGDGFYTQHNYTAWSFTFGYGTPPLEGFSLFVVVIIAIGLGVPALLAVSGVAYVLHKRCRQRNAPTRLTNMSSLLTS